MHYNIWNYIFDLKWQKETYGQVLFPVSNFPIKNNISKLLLSIEL